MVKQKNRKKRKISRQEESLPIDFREVAKLISIAAFVVIIVWAGKQIDDIPIKTIEIQSQLDKVSKSEIKTIAQNYIYDGFFTIDLAAFEGQLNEIPWVYRANIKRQWPSKVIIHIDEQQPYFRWGSTHLINKYAQVFYVGDTDGYSHLPLLQGVTGRAKQIIDMYYRYSKGFKNVDAEIISIKEDARYDKEIILSSGIAINLGREQTEKQIQRCLKSFAMFTKAEREAIASIDLRHSNGFAVRWNS